MPTIKKFEQLKMRRCLIVYTNSIKLGSIAQPLFTKQYLLSRNALTKPPFVKVARD